MEIIKNNYLNINNQEPLSIAIGNFDGVHIGHQELIKSALSYKDTKSAVMTFEPHVMQSFDVNFSTLFSLEDKIEKIEKLGINKMLIIEFNEEFKNLTVASFIAFLKKINVKRVIVGSDFRFGKKAIGKPADLSNDFEVIEIADLIVDDIKVSSTYLKKLVEENNFELLNRLLAEDYYIRGKIIHGNKIGSKIGFPTANIDYNDIVLPPNGVYYTIIKIADELYPSMTNIGHNPTLNFTEKIRLETHILNFKGTIYNQEIKLFFKKHLRNEIKYNRQSDLIKKMSNDKKLVRKLFEKDKNMLK